MDLKKLKSEEIDSDGQVNTNSKLADENQNVELPCQEDFDKGLKQILESEGIVTTNIEEDPNEEEKTEEEKDELEFNFFDETFA